MRKLALVLLGVLVGALGLQVGLAAEPQADTLTVCQRPGADLRSPATNGTCPSGYTKTEITETSPDEDLTYFAYDFVFGASLTENDGIVTSLTLPAGSYTVMASGRMSSSEGAVDCRLADAYETLDYARLLSLPGAEIPHETLSGSITRTQPGAVSVICAGLTGSGAPTSLHDWRINATQVDRIIVP
jgi:hypothetical protein